MTNFYFFYKYIITNHLILKFPKTKIKNITKLQKIEINSTILDYKKDYNFFYYNLCVLIFLITGKILKIKKNIELNVKIYSYVFLNLKESYLFLEIFAILLLPLLNKYNMPLNYKNFDIFANYRYQIKYVDPIFTSKNILASWSNYNKVNIFIHFKSLKKIHNFIFLQYLKFKF